METNVIWWVCKRAFKAKKLTINHDYSPYESIETSDTTRFKEIEEAPLSKNGKFEEKFYGKSGSSRAEMTTSYPSFPKLREIGDSFLLQTVDLPLCNTLSLFGVASVKEGTAQEKKPFASRAGYYAIKSLERLMIAQIKQHSSPLVLQKEFPFLFEKMAREVAHKCNLIHADLSDIGASFLSGALVENVQARKHTLMLMSLGDIMCVTYDINTHQFKNVVPAHYNEDGSDYLPATFQPKSCTPHLTLTTLSSTEIPLIMTKGLWEALPVTIWMRVPAYFERYLTTTFESEIVPSDNIDWQRLEPPIDMDSEALKKEPMRWLSVPEPVLQQCLEMRKGRATRFPLVYKRELDEQCLSQAFAPATPPASAKVLVTELHRFAIRNIEQERQALVNSLERGRQYGRVGGEGTLAAITPDTVFSHRSGLIR